MPLAYFLDGPLAGREDIEVSGQYEIQVAIFRGSEAPDGSLYETVTYRRVEECSAFVIYALETMRQEYRPHHLPPSWQDRREATSSDSMTMRFSQMSAEAEAELAAWDEMLNR